MTTFAQNIIIMTTTTNHCSIVNIDSLYFALLKNTEFIKELKLEISEGVCTEEGNKKSRYWFFKSQMKTKPLYVNWDYKDKFREEKMNKAIIKALRIFLTQEEAPRAAEYVAYLAQLWVDNVLNKNFNYRDYIFCCRSLDPALQAIFSGFNFLKINDKGCKKICNIDFNNNNPDDKDDTTGTMATALRAKFGKKDENCVYNWTNVANLFGSLVDCRNYQDHTTKSESQYFYKKIGRYRGCIKSLLVDLTTIVYFLLEYTNGWGNIKVPERDGIQPPVFKNPLFYAFDAIHQLDDKSQTHAINIITGNNLDEADKLYSELKERGLKSDEIKTELEQIRQEREELHKKIEQNKENIARIESNKRTTDEEISLLTDIDRQLKEKNSELSKKITYLEQQLQSINSDLKQNIDNLTSRLDKVENGLQRLFSYIKQWKKCLKWAIPIAGIIAVLALGWSVFRFCPAEWFSDKKELAYWAYRVGNKEVAWQRAELLNSDSTKTRQATYWYRKALVDLDDAVNNNTADSAHIMRLARMLTLGKGGIFDLDKATKLADKAGAYDYAAIIYGYTDDEVNACAMLDSSKDKTSDYYLIADAWQKIVNTHNLSDSTTANDSFETLIRMARESGTAGQEAIESIIRLNLNGATAKNGKCISKPNMYIAALNAKYAADKFNSLRACIELVSLYDYLGDINGLSTWRKKAVALGFSPSDNSNESFGERFKLNDPDALIQSAEMNYAKGFTDYEKTAALYGKAVGIMEKRNAEPVKLSILNRWFDLVANAYDLDSAHLLTKVRKDLPDSLRKAVVDFVMAKRYCRGLGDVEQDLRKGHHYMQKAADGGLTDAKIGVLLEQTRNKNANKDSLNAAFEQLDSLPLSAAHYLLTENMEKQNESGFNKWLQFIIKKYPYDLNALSMALRGMHFDRKSKQELSDMAKHIESVLSHRELSNERFRIFSLLSQIYHALGENDMAEFYNAVSLYNDNEHYRFEFDVFGVSKGYFETSEPEIK